MTEAELLKLKEAYEVARKESWDAAEAYISTRTGVIDPQPFAAAVARMNAIRANYHNARVAYEAERSKPPPDIQHYP